MSDVKNGKPRSSGKVTSHDVAQHAGVSRSAVSRTFTPGAYVSDHVRQKVLDAAKELGYLPNVLARSLIGGSSGLVAMIVGPMASPNDSLLIESATRKLAEIGKRTLLVPIPTSGVADDSLLQALSYQVEAAIIFAGTVGADAARRCTRIGTRLTLFGRAIDHPGARCVIYDNTAAATAATRHLLRGGHKKIGYIGTRHHAFSDDERRRAVEAVLAEHNMTLHAYGEGDYGHDSGYQTALAMLGAMDPPDAIFSSNDGMALGVLDAARALGISVPRELAVVGIDNNPMGAWPAYQLTSWGVSADTIADVILRETFDELRDDPMHQDTEGAPSDISATPRSTGSHGPETTTSPVIRIPLTVTLRNSTRQPGHNA